MINILKNNYCRMYQRLSSEIVLIVITLLSIIFAVFMTEAQQVKGHIVFVSKSSASTINSKYLSVVTMKEEPPYSALVKQQYDAYVIDKGNGKYDIKTLRNDNFKKMIKYIIENPKAPIAPQKTDRGIGVNIVGFLLIFLLMQIFMYFFTFAEDKEQKLLMRITTSPISFLGYLSAHCISCLSIFFLPPYLMIVIMELLGYNIGFSLLEYLLIFAVIGFLGISFTLLLNTLISRPANANLLGNSLIILSSILSGSFYSFSKDNKVLDDIITIMPQKQLLDFTLYMQNQEAIAHVSSLLYVIIFSAVMFIISYVFLSKKYVNKLQ